MSTNYKLQTTSSRRGVALLMAVLLSSVMLSVGLGVYQRTYKQLVFASFWKQMQVAFAAADSGLECALYWDLHQVGATSADCFGAAIPGWNPSLNTTTTFTMSTTAGCVIVNITKPSPVGVSTMIESRGYNDACESTNPRRVERGLRIDY